MRARHVLGRAAIAVAGVSAVPAAAAEVQPGGALDIKIDGFIRFLAIGGDRDRFLLNNSQSSGLDFFNDTVGITGMAAAAAPERRSPP
jgi:hypothetical protein